MPFQNIPFQRAGVDANPDGNSCGFRRFQYRSYLIFAPDIAGIDANFVSAVFDRLYRQLGAVVNIGHQRDMNLFLDRGKRIHRSLIRHSDTDNVATLVFKTQDLLHGAGNIMCFGNAHGLYRNFVRPADSDITNPYFPRSF